MTCQREREVKTKALPKTHKLSTMWPRLPNLQCQPGKTYLAAVHVSASRKRKAQDIVHSQTPIGLSPPSLPGD